MIGFSAVRARIADKCLVLVAVTIGMFMSLLDNTIVNVAIPQLQHAFGADVQAVQWVVTVYMLTQAAVIPTAPYLTMRFGSKRAYVWTLTAFLLGSLLCGFAWDLPSLIVFRFIQGIGGGILLPLVMTLLYQAFPQEERGMAASTMGAALMAAPALGPVFGGFLVSYWGWEWAFFINVPIGAVAVYIAQSVLQPAAGRPSTRFDLVGFLAAASGGALLLYAVSTATAAGPVGPKIALFAASIALLAVFATNELRRVRQGKDVLLDLRRFGDRSFTLSSVANIFLACARFGMLFLLPIYLQTVRGQTAFQAGTVQIAQAVTTLVLLPFAGRLADRIGPRPVVITGTVLMAVAAALMSLLGIETSVWLIVVILIVLGASYALLQQVQVAAMSQISKDDHAAVANGSTLYSVLTATAAPLGVALLSGLAEARSRVYGATLPELPSLALAMHDGFRVAVVLVLLALVTLWFVPKRLVRSSASLVDAAI